MAYNDTLTPPPASGRLPPEFALIINRQPGRRQRDPPRGPRKQIPSITRELWYALTHYEKPQHFRKTHEYPAMFLRRFVIVAEGNIRVFRGCSTTPTSGIGC